MLKYKQILQITPERMMSKAALSRQNDFDIKQNKLDKLRVK